jgi:hypothetical protein
VRTGGSSGRQTVPLGLSAALLSLATTQQAGVVSGTAGYSH